MTPVELDALPTTLRSLARAAEAVGWSVTATAADGPPPTLALRFAHDQYRAYATWKLDKGVGWWTAGCRHIPPGHFDTLGKFKRYLGVK